MNHKRYSAFILAMALLIIGMRGVCMAQFSQRVAIEKSDTQEWNEVQVVIAIHKSTQSTELRGVGFTFRVKRYGFALMLRNSSSPTEIYSSHKKAQKTQCYSKISCAFCASLPPGLET